MWTHNGTWEVAVGAGTREAWLPVVGGVMCVVSILTVLLNVFVVLAVLLHTSSRSRSFHLHIVNMAVIAVLQGAGVLPLWTHYLMQKAWLHGDSVCRWWLAADTMATSSAALALVITACDRFIYLVCWRFVKEGGKYVTCCVLMTLAWLLALALTLTLTLTEADKDHGSWNGVQEGGLCNWGLGKGERVVAARLIMYVVGAGLGAGLSLALVTLPCLGLGHVLPVDETEGEEMVRRRSLLHQNSRDSQSHHPHHPHHPKRSLSSSSQPPNPHRSLSHDHGDDLVDDEAEDFPHFAIVKKTDRLEERERWKWQVTSLVTVALAWAVLWLPAHLLTFAEVLGLEWRVPRSAVVAAVLLGYAHAAVMPLLWLLHQPIRVAMASLLFCRCCRSDPDDDEDSLEFQDVGPYRPAEVTG